MATTFTSSKIATTNSSLWLYLEVTVNSQSVTNNTSNITVKLIGQKATSTTIDTYSTSNNNKMVIYVSGKETITFTNEVRIPKGGTKKTIWSKSYTISHGSTGKKDMTIKLESFHLEVSNPTCDLKSAFSFNITLPVINVCTKSTFSSGISPSSSSPTSIENQWVWNINQSNNDVKHNVDFTLGNTTVKYNNIDEMSPSDTYGYLTLASIVSTTGISRRLSFKPGISNFAQFVQGDTSGQKKFNFFKEFTTQKTMKLTVTLTSYRDTNDAAERKNALGSSTFTSYITIPDKYAPVVSVGSAVLNTAYYPIGSEWTVSSGNPSYVKHNARTLSTIVISNKTTIDCTAEARKYNTTDASAISYFKFIHGTTTMSTMSGTWNGTVEKKYSYTIPSKANVSVTVANKRGQTTTKNILPESQMNYYNYQGIAGSLNLSIARSTDASTGEVKRTGIVYNWNYSGASIITINNTRYNYPVAALYLKRPNSNSWEEIPIQVREDMPSYANGGSIGLNPNESQLPSGTYTFRFIYHDAFGSGVSEKSAKLIAVDEYDNDAINRDLRPRYLNMSGRSLGIGGFASGDDNTVTFRWKTEFRQPIVLTPDLCITAGTGSALVVNTTNNRIYSSSSARKYKKNIRYDLDFDRYHDIFTKINPIEYEFKDSDDLQLGFLADDIEKLNPDMIIKNSKGDVENYKDRDMLALLYLEVKRHNELIEKLIKATGIETDNLSDDVIDVEPVSDNE
jgi:hypothetical protein